MGTCWLTELDDLGETPLTRASRSGNSALAELVLAPESDASDYCDKPWLHHVVRQGDATEVLEALEEGASPNEPDFLGMTALHWAALGGRPEIVQMLIDWGAEINVRDSFIGGITALSMARMMGYEQVAQKLLAYGATD